MIHRTAIGLFGALVVVVTPSVALADKLTCASAADEGSVLRKDVSKLTRARELLRVCNAEECDADIRDDCRRWLDELEADLPTVVLAAEDEEGLPVASVKVLLDGAPFVRELDGKAVAVDVGQHTFTFLREGAPPIEVKALVRLGKKNAEVLARYPRPAPALAPVPASAARPRTRHASSSNVLRPIGLGIAGLGVVGLGLSAFFGVRAMNQQSEASCPENRCRPEDAPKLEDAAATARISTGFFVGGAALAASGLALYLLAPRSTNGVASVRVVPSLGASSAAVVVEGMAF